MQSPGQEGRDNNARCSAMSDPSTRPSIFKKQGRGAKLWRRTEDAEPAGRLWRRWREEIEQEHASSLSTGSMMRASGQGRRRNGLSRRRTLRALVERCEHGLGD